ncbi:unnamed protein product [Rotaria magnacalcarata]|uniref:tRNA (adenine(58)-N(1))-methyltransferase catalytic subunit TRMT61A n=1 Tax=Rotaria magnacalcarata TaxID=392030 RepID=A0A8S2KR21_9BILA|nr:unnamed protein product [Rotaria magnacalcarata]
MTNLIQEGSKVILYLGYNNLHVIKVKTNEVYQTKFGALKHNDLVGKEFGSKIMCTKGYIHALSVIPELWTLALPHRTQILYMADISLILLELDIKPGSVVIEAGTGSGSLSHSIIRSLRPNGHLYTFEFHELRSTLARNEFEEHGLSQFVTAQHRDVLSTNGFEEISTVECLRRVHEFRYQHRSKINFTADQKQKAKIDTHSNKREPNDDDVDENDDEEKTPNKKRKNDSETTAKNQPRETESMLTAIGPLVMPGHTGYLTFAYLKQN